MPPILTGHGVRVSPDNFESSHMPPQGTAGSFFKPNTLHASGHARTLAITGNLFELHFSGQNPERTAASLIWPLSEMKGILITGSLQRRLADKSADESG